jgi:hypothetical protein
MALRSTTPASTKLFGIDIAGAVSSAIAGAGGVTPAVLIKRGPRVRATADPANGTRSTDTRIACRGIDERRDGAHAVTLLGASIVYQGARVVPEVGDAIEIGGYQVEVGAVEVDPAAAAYTCTAAGAVRGQR